MYPDAEPPHLALSPGKLLGLGTDHFPHPTPLSLTSRYEKGRMGWGGLQEKLTPSVLRAEASACPKRPEDGPSESEPTSASHWPQPGGRGWCLILGEGAAPCGQGQCPVRAPGVRHLLVPAARRWEPQPGRGSPSKCSMSTPPSFSPLHSLPLSTGPFLLTP